jgi:hypothetical protein
MIRLISNEVERYIPPPLLHTKIHNESKNQLIQMKHARRFIPYLASEVAKYNTQHLNEIKYARHILHRYHCDFARSIVLNYLKFDTLF